MRCRIKERLPEIVEAFAVGLAFSAGCAVVGAVFLALFAALAHAAVPEKTVTIPRAALQYRATLMSTGKSLVPCDRMAFVLSAYNGGAGWVNRDRNLAAKRGLDPDRYFGSVETVNAGRRASAIRENRRYVSRIMEYQHAYIRAGWGPGVSCDGA